MQDVVPMVLLDEHLTRHLGRLLETHDAEDGWSDVTELAVLDGDTLVLRDVDTWNWVE